MKLQIKKLEEDVKTPRYAHEGDAGMDVYSRENHILKPGERHLFKLGFAMSFEPGYVCHVWDKSGLAAKHGIKTMGGVIEHTYRGEIGVILYNTSDEEYEVRKGDKIAQMVFVPVATAETEEVEELTDTKRGKGGFGSTGKR